MLMAVLVRMIMLTMRVIMVMIVVMNQMIRCFAARIAAACCTHNGFVLVYI